MLPCQALFHMDTQRWVEDTNTGTREACPSEILLSFPPPRPRHQIFPTPPSLNRSHILFKCKASLSFLWQRKVMTEPCYLSWWKFGECHALNPFCNVELAYVSLLPVLHPNKVKFCRTPYVYDLLYSGAVGDPQYSVPFASHLWKLINLKTDLLQSSHCG